MDSDEGGHVACRTKDDTRIAKGKTLAAVEKVILGVLGKVPQSSVNESANPRDCARRIARLAAAKAAAVSGFLSLPPGPLGFLTIIPELEAVWRIQRQMVADIAACFGKKSSLTEEQMLYCLFRHVAAQATRDLVVRVGERVLVRRATLRTLQAAARRIGVKVTQRLIGRGISRWLPIVGAVAVGGYAFYDTMCVADNAIDLFAHECIEVSSELTTP
jgi:hypothetical protein